MRGNCNGLMIAGVVLNLLIGLCTAIGYREELPVIILIFAIFAIISIAGLIISAVSRSKAGPITVMVGSIFFIPLGLVAVFGARKALDALKIEEFDSFKPSTPASTAQGSAVFEAKVPKEN